MRTDGIGELVVVTGIKVRYLAADRIAVYLGSSLVYASRLNLRDLISLLCDVARIVNRRPSGSGASAVVCRILIGIYLLNGVLRSGRQVRETDNFILL